MRYKKIHEVLNIRELVFETGKSYGLVGHNGAGKTTLFKCITNIICDYQGTIAIDGVVVKDHNDVLSNVGIVLDGISVYRNRTGWFNIDYFSGLRGVDNRERAQRLAQELELHHALDHKVSTYSYGMQKKLILLIALLSSPKVLILDEPFRGLDIETVKWFKSYLKQLTDHGLTLLISSHVQNDLEELCEEVFVINRGKIVDHIDLTVEKRKLIRVVDTSDNRAFIQLLDNAHFAYELVDDGKIKVDIGHASWSDIYNKLQQDNIEILELSKIKILEDKLN